MKSKKELIIMMIQIGEKILKASLVDNSSTKALKEMDTRIQIFDMEEMILLLNANLGERWYADFERLKSNFMKEMS